MLILDKSATIPNTKLKIGSSREQILILNANLKFKMAARANLNSWPF